jgi:ribose/xylose/arabinose/galactoside ABC-type transport system permease subunit
MKSLSNTVGIVLIVAGILVLIVGNLRIPLGRLPGDIAYQGRNFSFYLPLATSLLLSVVLSLVFYLISRFAAEGRSIHLTGLETSSAICNVPSLPLALSQTAR